MAEPVTRPAERRRRPPMSKTGIRMLGTFVAVLIGWIWAGWLAPLTGVQMTDGMLSALGPACVVVMEWLFCREDPK